MTFAYKVKWFIHPSQIKNIYWKDIEKDPQETVNFENDGDGVSKYIWANRKKDNRFVRVGKVMKNFVFLPFIFGTTSMLYGITVLYQFMDSHETSIILFCSYSILFLVSGHYILSNHERRKKKKKREMVFEWMVKV